MPSSSEQTVLFVCVENTFRSIISEAIFNAYAPKGWRAESAGVRPAATINPVAIDLLNEIGVEIELRKPGLVTPEMITRAAKVITFGCLDRCPIRAKEKSADWPIPGSTTGNGDLRNWNELRAIRGDLERRILRLIHEIDRNTRPE